MAVIKLPKLSIEPLTPEQLEPVAVFFHHNWHLSYDAFVEQAVLQQRNLSFFKHYLNNKLELCWIALQGEKVAGLVCVGSNCIEDLYVDEKLRRRKIGTRLVDKALKHFKTRGFSSAQTGCESFNEKTVQFFIANNWKQIGSQSLYARTHQPVNALVLSTQIYYQP